jgi:hypothetical protein
MSRCHSLASGQAASGAPVRRYGFASGYSFGFMGGRDPS